MTTWTIRDFHAQDVEGILELWQALRVDGVEPVYDLSEVLASCEKDHAVVAIHDEIDLPFDTVKLKLGGGEGGHNGLRDISRTLGTKDYYRVRAGVGRPPGRADAASHVLRDFSTAENKTLPFLIDNAADAVELLVSEGLLAAQQKFN